MKQRNLSELFDSAWAYRIGQGLLYKSGAQNRYVSEFVRPQPGYRILDIGCGPAAILSLLPNVRYCGIDPNPAYIEEARNRYGSRGEFRCGYLRAGAEWHGEKFDLVMANGVLHHVSDSDAQALLATASGLLRPGGRFVSRDGCFAPGQSTIARFILQHDRGNFVRDQPGYERLLTAHFKLRRAELREDMLRIPYPLLLCEAVREP